MSTTKGFTGFADGCHMLTLKKQVLISQAMKDHQGWKKREMVNVFSNVYIPVSI